MLSFLNGITPQEDVKISTTAYDCGIRRHNNIDIATYSLLDAGECKLNPNKVNVTEVNGQIVQKAKIRSIMVFQCKIKLHRTVQRCSLFGYLEPVENGVQQYLLEISRDQCKKLHETGIFIYSSNKIISDVKVNASTTRSIYLAGDAIDNSCNVGSFSDRFGSYSKVLVQGIFTITLMSYNAKLDAENKILNLVSGLNCEFDKMSCLDSMNGLTIWERITNENCYSEKLELVYEGKISMVNESNNNNTKITYFIDNDSYLISLEHKGYIEVCYNKFIRTQSAETYILVDVKNFLKFSQVVVDYNIYFANKLTVVYKTLDSQIKDTYIQNGKENCENQLSIIKKKLLLAETDPEQFAYDLMGPGHMAQLGGNVIHIIKCQPVEVLINPNPNSCTNEIPILYHNEPMFISSKSRIIIKHARKMPCNRLFPVKFRINGLWIKFTPKLRYAKTPKTLGPKPRENSNPTEIQDLEGRGIYSKEDIDNYQKSINFPIERTIILDNTAKEVINIKDKDSDDNFIETYLKRNINKYWEEYKDFGSISAAICATIAIILLIGWVINTTMNALQIKNIVGCSTKLGAALFSSATNQILIRANRTPYQESNTDANEEIELNEIEITEPRKTQIPIPKKRTLTNPVPKCIGIEKLRSSFKKPKCISVSTQVKAHDIIT